MNHVLTQATPAHERRPAVFISYHRETGGVFAKQLIAALTTAGHAHWIDETEVQGGEDWDVIIPKVIEHAYAMVVIVTPEALTRDWVRTEIKWARKQFALRQPKPPLIPLLLQDVTYRSEYFLLEGPQPIKFFGCDWAIAFDKLLRALPPPPKASCAPSEVSHHNSLELMQEAERDYLNRLSLNELRQAEKYTPLAGASQRQAQRAEMRPVFELLPLRLGKARHELVTPRRFENAVEEIQKLRRAVLLGEPGAGKTTTLLRLAAKLVERAREDANAPLPLLIRLGRWTEAAQTLPDFIATELGALGSYLELLLKNKRAALLLDGLNELPASQRADKYRQVQQFIEQQRQPDLMAVVSCRALDYTLDLGFDRINITPLDPLRIREFVARYLGAEQGEALFWKLAGQAAKDTLTRFMREFENKLPESERVFWNEAQLPPGFQWGYKWRGENDNAHWQRWLELRETPSSLMVLARNPYMLLMLASVYAEQGELPENRGELFDLFVQTLLDRERIPAEERAPLTDGLARVAYEMQIRRAQAGAGNALTVLPEAEVKTILNERLLYLAGSASLLNLGEQVRFSHQLLQEYFAAKFMDNEIRAGHLPAARLWPPDRWWERNNWEEAAILLAGLYSDDCTRVVEWLAEANPEIAAQCLTRSGATLARATRDATRARLRAAWLPRLADWQREPQAQGRAAVGRALGQTGLDNRAGVGLRADGLPDIEWIEIAGGKFEYGLANDDYAAKPQTLELPTFFMSRYPVTQAQYQAFLEAPDGYADARWFEGLAASEEARRMAEPAFKFSNHPRKVVNWYQALAYCRWLSWRWGGGYELKKLDEWAVRLPTEYEWEKAARGTDGRLYPYGNEFDAAKSNVHETGIGQTSAVGLFPHGASPYGVEELSGNVWEWCLSDYEKPQLEARKEKLKTDKTRVLRGGSWINNPSIARAAYRDINNPAVRNSNIGFRVVVVRPPH